MAQFVGLLQISQLIIRRVIYTTNAIEAVHRQFRKLTKTKGAFPNENSAQRVLYMGIARTLRKNGP